MRSLLLLCLLTLGCDSTESSPTSPSQPNPPQKVTVLATAYPLAEMARRIGGEFVDVTWLCESGQRPEDVEATNDLRQRANATQVVITSGPWDDAWAVSELTREARANRVVEPHNTPAARAANADARAYAWLDPAVVRETADLVRARLTAADPKHDAHYRAAAAAYVAEVAAVERELDALLKDGVGRRVVVVRPAWHALLARYRIVPLMPTRERSLTEDVLTPADFKELARLAATEKATHVYVDAATAAPIRLRIENQTKLTALTLDALGTSAPAGRSTWAEVVRYDAAQLRKSWEAAQAPGAP